LQSVAVSRLEGEGLARGRLGSAPVPVLCQQVHELEPGHGVSRVQRGGTTQVGRRLVGVPRGTLLPGGRDEHRHEQVAQLVLRRMPGLQRLGGQDVVGAHGLLQ
jgi:hypothetical protein